MQNEIKDEAFESQPKWQSRSSFILGIITAIPVLCTLIGFSIQWTLSHTSGIISVISRFTDTVGLIWFYIGGWILPAAGFVLGIMGLKYTKKRLAVTGIILSIFGFLTYTFLHYFWTYLG